ncbi:acetoin dehydrogenase dihydrolipoyllysine-residue acetyltransferase subunit [Rhizobium rhizosphaerae]|uniref:acetoin dehydrogenase dihydrolipoyllysine-residue acetyltransferase subunit n=1 Tax=Xaviernesmea rhizosphaerae TaxID=1672749 RepID=UPI001118973E|nr:acetoin dehydrogenase dihydrolipoyllysine-residue acetyltransferase subunit [Xaviernesmea rhizosphaerae]
MINQRFLKMPRLGETMEEGKIVGWLVKPGEAFSRGDPILEIETDKTIAEFPALGDGRLNEILVGLDETVEVGHPIASIEIGTGPDWTADEGASEPASDARTPSVPVVQEAGLAETDLTMPRLGETMEEGRIAKWLKAEGDSFERGEALLEIETDKTIAEFPALFAGRILTLLKGEDETVAVGAPIARILAPSETAAEAGPADLPAPAASNRPAEQVRPAQQGPAQTTLLRATPLARRLARARGIDLTQLKGTGRRGRIERDDVLAFAGQGRVEPSVQAASALADDVSMAALTRGRMAYLDNAAGQGVPLLLLHGFAGDHTTWATIAAGLKRAGRRVIIPDLPAHGLTEIEESDPYGLGSDLVELLARLGVDQVSVLAHSLGAVAAVNLAKAAPERVRALTLIAPAGLGREIDTGFIDGMAGARHPGEVAHLLRRLSVQGMALSENALVKLTKTLSAGRLKALAGNLSGPFGQRIDTIGLLQALPAQLPVRVLFGLDDRIIPWTQVAALPPRVAIHLLARAGHMPHWDQTREVLDIILSQGATR